MAKRVSKSAAKKLHPKKRKRATPEELPKLDPSDPDYFADLGERGGLNTLKNKGPEFFQYIARLSHESRRRNKIKRSNDKRGLPTVFE